jgi:hypothetical protein
MRIQVYAWTANRVIRQCAASRHGDDGDGDDRGDGVRRRVETFDRVASRAPRWWTRDDGGRGAGR